MDAITRFYKAHNRPIKIAICVALGMLILSAYALIVILFVKPTHLRLQSLLVVADDPRRWTGLTPAVAVALLQALLTAATLALVTRCVDESLWNSLTPSNNQARLTIRETRQVAQWSISVFARIRYLGIGDSWTLRFSGLFLLAFGAVNPVLLSGVGQTSRSTFETTYRPRNTAVRVWNGFLDDVNTWYASGTTRDLLGETAFLASLNSLNAPAANVCSSSSCSVNARMAGYQATCKSEKFSNTDGIGLTTSSNTAKRRFCSSVATGGQPCVYLERSNPATSANFTNVKSNTDAGEFTTIFGAYTYNWTTVGVEHPIYTIDCRVRYGWVNITQQGFNPPEVLRDSFKVVGVQELSPVTNFLGRIYGGDMLNSSGWAFLGGSYGANGERIVIYPIGYALLGWRETVDGETVAKRIERAWDMNNIFAFGRAGNSIDIATTIETEKNYYTYDKRVLAVLFVPLLALVLGVWGRWYVLDDELMMGYDPIKIVRSGPLYGIDPSENEEELDKMMVARYAHPDVDAAGGYAFVASRVNSVAAPVQEQPTVWNDQRQEKGVHYG